jgi:hypothetical protein
MQTFHLGQRLYQNICYLLICGDILENHFSLLDFIMENIMLDLKCTSVSHGTLFFSEGFI